MAKIISQLGKVAGAVSSVIAASYGGAVIIRSRNPKKRQVNSVGQVESRAKLKLIGQIAAELAPVIVIPPSGTTSSRNLFIKKNYNDIYCNENIAQISYENIQITGGMAGLPPIFVQREPSKGVQVRLAEDMQSGVDRVVYIMYKKTIAERLVYVDSVIAHAAGDDKLYPAVLPYTEGDIIILAYGMKDVTANGAVKYGETRISTAMDVAQLYLRHIKGKKDTIFTMTRGTTLFDGQQESEIVPEGYARVFVTAFGDGSVSGAGVYRIGDMVTITATPDVDYEFVGWMVNGSEEVISTDAQFTFVLTGQMDLVAKFAYLPASSYVDMGLPSGTLWARCNIDVMQPNKFAASPFQYKCSFFSWGNVDGHNPTSNTSFAPWSWGSINRVEPWYEGQIYGNTNGCQLQTDIPPAKEYDAARANLGTPWRLPTESDVSELFNNSIFIDGDGNEISLTQVNKLVNINEVWGIYIQSKINGARLFFACVGTGNGETLSNSGKFGNYWTSSFISIRNAINIHFDSSLVIPQSNNARYLGFAIRPVLKR